MSRPLRAAVGLLVVVSLAVPLPLRSVEPLSSSDVVARARQRAAEILGVASERVAMVSGGPEAVVEIGSRRFVTAVFASVPVGEQALVAVDLESGITLDSFQYAQVFAQAQASRDKFTPEARAELANAPGQMIQFAFFLETPDYGPVLEASKKAHPEVTWDGDRPMAADGTANERARLDHIAAKGRAVAAARVPFVLAAQRAGARIEGALDLAPVVYVWATPETAEELSRRQDVTEIMLPASFSLAMDIAKPAIGANVTEAGGLDGSGIKLGIVEYAKVNWAHTGLDTVPHTSRKVQGGACVNGQGGPHNSQDHMSWVTAIAASRAVGFPGIANDVFIVESSADADEGADASDLLIHKAAECAILAGATVLNLSLVQNNAAQLGTSDRIFDEYVDQSHVTVVAASGDHGPADGNPGNPEQCPNDHKVQSPARAWNVIAVGSYDDRGVLGSGTDHLWWRLDDTGPAYCWQDPDKMPWDQTNDREKPEFVAPGPLIRTSTGHHMSGTSASSPMAAATVATLMENDLSLRSEPERVRAILVAASKFDRTPTPGGGFNQDMEGWGSLNANWSNKVADQGGNGKNGRRNFTAVDTGVPSCPFTRPGAQVVTFDGAPNRFIRFVITWNSHTLGGIDSRAVDFNLTIKNPAGAVIGSSNRFASNYEVVEFDPDVHGIGVYSATITPVGWQCNAPADKVGWAWVSF